jgi:hypothetical protein
MADRPEHERLIVDSRKASFSRGVGYLYHEAIFDRTVVKVVHRGRSGGGEGEKLFVVVLRSLLSSDEYQGITIS